MAQGLPTHTKVLLDPGHDRARWSSSPSAGSRPRSAAYRKWTAAFVVIGSVWTAIILSIVYFASVSIVGIGMRLLGKDPLDRGLKPEPTLLAAARAEPARTAGRVPPPVLMPTHVLGLSCFYHDSAAALLRDGVVVAACQEERLSRKRHDSGVPRRGRSSTC